MTTQWNSFIDSLWTRSWHLLNESKKIWHSEIPLSLFLSLASNNVSYHFQTIIEVHTIHCTRILHFIPFLCPYLLLLLHFGSFLNRNRSIRVFLAVTTRNSIHNSIYSTTLREHIQYLLMSYSTSSSKSKALGNIREETTSRRIYISKETFNLYTSVDGWAEVEEREL